LLRDELYDTICFLTTTSPPAVGVGEPDSRLGFTAFIEDVVARVAELQTLRHEHNLEAAEIGRMLGQRDDVNDIVAGVASTTAGLNAVERTVIARRRALLATLRKIVLDRGASEAQVQQMIGRQYWIFGGQYTAVLDRRNAMPLDQHDIPLIRADRSIHVVELKKPGAELVQRHRNHLIVADEVHQAASQCMNYIRTFDEMGAALQTHHHNELGMEYDYRRASGTVVIGHPAHVETPGVTREQIDQTIRSYNAHLSRVNILTYADLLDSADRSLRFEEQEHGEYRPEAEPDT
jgi:hypothetical protein